MNMMRTSALVFSLCATLGVSAALAQEASGQQVTEAETHVFNSAPASNFSGRAEFAFLPALPSTGDVAPAIVRFEANTITNWHIHPHGQYLIVTEGEGRTQQWGAPIQIIRKNDVVWCPPGVKHWHGASTSSAMSHIAISPVATDGQSVTWLEAVELPADDVARQPATQTEAQNAAPPMVIAEQGSFAIGGSVINNPGTFDPVDMGPEGQSLHGDHAYVFYQIPEQARELPLVLWHGFGQSAKTWESTPDGREGYQNIFLRRGYGVYLLDQPRRGRAGRSTQPVTISAAPDDQRWFNIFRVGIWPDYFDGVQFPQDPASLNQYFRQMTPDTGPADLDVNSAAVAALFDNIGEGILVTHSHSGGMGWRTVINNKNIRAVVSYEPGSGFVFPEGEVPDPMPSAGGTLAADAIALADFMTLTEIPIVIYFGDNIPEQAIDNPGQDQWRVRLDMARLWADTINRHGGDATVVHLPDVGLQGNTHFPFSDLNNLEVADLMSAWLNEKGLD